MKKLTSLLLTLCMVFALTACGGEKITFEKGSIEGNTYTNTSIGIKMTAPEGFEVAGADVIAALEASTQNVAEQTGSADATAAISYEAVMMTPDGTSMVQVMAEDMTKSIGKGVSAKTYLTSAETQAETQYAAMGITAKAESLGTVEIGGKKFEGLKVAAEANGVSLTQNYYVYRAGDVMFEIITTGTSDTEAALSQFISSIEAVE